jgi:Arylsulfotransferase (ASST)
MSALTVTSPSNASLALVPSFSPSVYNYYVLCGPGSNALEVSFTAGSGELGALVIARQGSLPKSPESSAWTASQTTSLNVEENAAVVAFATNASKSTTIEYWVRCLPDDFPDIQMSPNPSAGTPPDGYYLLGNRTLNGTPAPGGYAMVLDIRGVPVWYLRMPSGQGVINVDDVVPGAITLLESNLNQYEVHFLDPLHTTIAAPPNSSLVTSPNLEDQHELQYLPNGNFMVISNPSIAVDMSGVTTTEGSSIALGPNTYIRACDVIEFNPNKGNEIIWQWKGALHIDAQKESTIADYSGIPAPAGAYVPYVVDALHCNSIDLDPEGNGNLLMSARNMDAVWYVENPGGASPTAGKILWKLGGKKYSQDNATLLTAADPFYRQHDARFVSWNADCDSGTGQISVFDDESDEPNPARGVIYDVVVGGGSSAGCKPIGAAPGTAVVAWQYKGVVASYGTGSFRSTNLGRVIGWGFGGEQKLVFTEVDESGNDLLDFYFNDDNSSYRTVKVPLSEFPLDVLRQTAGGNETTFP